MTKYEINLELQGGKTIGFEVNSNTFTSISKYCQDNFPEYNWEVLKQLK